jgi:tetratricopeptide (TPR) repeat protein
MPDAIAEMEYRILLEYQPDNTEARNELAMVLYRLDKLDEAFGELQRVVELNPDTV